MSQMRRAAVAACAAAAMIVPTAGLAQGGPDSSTYLGGTVGQSQAKDFCTGVTTGGGTTCDDKYTSWSILIGYQWNRHLGFEIGYRDLGQASANGLGGNVTAEAHAFETVVLGILPVGERFSVYGKFGAYLAESDLVTTAPNSVASEHDSNIDLTYGVGVQFELTKQFGVRAEWQRYQDIGPSNMDVDAISLGLIWRFR